MTSSIMRYLMTSLPYGVEITNFPSKNNILVLSREPLDALLQKASSLTKDVAHSAVQNSHRAFQLIKSPNLQ